MSEITIDAVFVRLLLQGLQRQGHSGDSLLLNHGLSPIGISRSSQRIKLDQFAAFAVGAMAKLDDEFLGLGQARQPLGSFAMACHACISARDLGSSLKRYANFWNLFAHSYRHQVILSDDQVQYTLLPIDGHQAINNYLVEACLSSAHRFHCWLGGQFIQIKSVTMQCPEPDYADQLPPLFYGASIEFEQASNNISFARSTTELQIAQTPATLDEYLAGKNLSLLYQPRNYRALSEQVRQWLEKNIERGETANSLVDAASYFDMSQQVLHRRLQFEEQSFKEIKKQTRRDIAINQLAESDKSVEQIAHHLGFSEPSAFIRAFKAWTGTTPLNYRHQNR